MFITLEGLDKSGKTEQIRQLKRDYPEWKFYNDPSHDVLDGKIREWLLYDNKINDEAQLFLHLASRALLGEHIQADLENGKTVVCDRWADSTLVFQGYYKDWYSKIERKSFNDMNRIATLSTRDTESKNYKYYLGLVPDLTIFLDTPVDLCEKRLHKEGDTTYDKEFKDLTRLKRIREYYKFIVNQDKLNRFATVDGGSNKDKIYTDIIAVLKMRGVNV